MFTLRERKGQKAEDLGDELFQDIPWSVPAGNSIGFNQLMMGELNPGSLAFLL